MLTVAAQLADHTYPEREDPQGAFEWWLNPCGGDDLVPDDVKKAFGILNTALDGVSSFNRKKTKVKQGSGKKGDKGNPKPGDRAKPKNRVDECPLQLAAKGPPGSKILGVAMPPCPKKPAPKRKCKVPPRQATRRLNGNTMRTRSCSGDHTITNEIVITSVVYAPNANPIKVAVECKKKWGQACYHHSSAIRVNPQWATLTCPQEAATTAYRLEGVATDTWSAQHTGAGWVDDLTQHCDRDEYPPANLLDEKSPAWYLGGKSPQGQLVRFIPLGENRGAGSMWKGVCIRTPTQELSDAEFHAKVAKDPFLKTLPGSEQKDSKNPAVVTGTKHQVYAQVTVTSRPEFSINSWGHAANPAPEDGLRENTCWPSVRAAKDPGIALLTFDPFYAMMGKPPYNYAAKYEKGPNGS
jgi:hypothetical protein